VRGRPLSQSPESAELFEALIENSSDAVAIVNARGQIAYESPAVERLLGWTPEERIGSSPPDFVHPDDLAKASAIFNELLQSPGATLRDEIRLVHKDGSVRHVELSGQNLLHKAAVAGIVANLRDITERHKMEEALKLGEAKFRLITDNVGDVIWTMDIDLNFTYISPSTQRLVGYTPEEEAAVGLAGILTPDSLEVAWKTHKRTLAAEESDDDGKPFRSVTVELDHVHKDGRIVPTEVRMTFLRDSDGRPTGILGITRDITKRRQYEEAIRESEEKYRSVVERANDGIAIIQDGILKFGNRRSLEILGYTPQEIMDTPMSRYVHPDELPRVLARYKRRMAGERVDPVYETALLHKDGRRVDVELNAGLTTFEGRPANLVIVRDITERKLIEQELERSEESHRLVVESLQDGVIVIDAETLTVVFSNRRAAQFMGFKSVDDFVGASVLSIMHPDHEKAVARAFEEDLHQDRRQRYEFKVVGNEGQDRWISVLATRIQFRGRESVLISARDITEAKQSEKALRESEERYRLLAENTADVIVSTDLNAHPTYISPSITRLLGYSVEESMNRTLDEALTPASREVAKAGLARLLGEDRARPAKGTGRRGIELELLRKDGSTVWAEVTISVVRNAQGTPDGIVVVLRDIDARKKAEEEKQQMEQQLHLSARLAAVGELAAGVAHELNNPLAAVQAFSQFLSERADLDETAKRDAETIYKESRRASRITGNLLSFARKHKPDRSLVSINEVVEKSLELHDYRLKVNNIEVVRDLDPDLPMAMADFHQMQQVFVNIITNAEQAMTQAHGGGRLVVQTRTIENAIQISFDDNGPGLTDEDLGHVFDPFFTTKDVGQGTGLGLSICYGIVNEHGGTIRAASGPGRGATFVVEIPVDSGCPLPAEEVESTHHLQSFPHYL